MSNIRVSQAMVAVLFVVALFAGLGLRISTLLAAEWHGNDGPRFAFVDRQTLLPPSLPAEGIVHVYLGREGTLVVRHGNSLYLISAGAATTIVTHGQQFPDGVTADISRIYVYAVSPTKAFLRQPPEPFVPESTERFYLWDGEELSTLVKPQDTDFNLQLNDGAGRFLGTEPIFEDDFGEQVIVGSRFFITDGVTEGQSHHVTSGAQTVVHITPDGGLLVQEETASGGQFVKRYFWAGARSGEVATNGGSTNVNLDFMAANPAGDVLLRRTTDATMYELLLYPASGGSPTLVAEAGIGKPYEQFFWPGSPFNNASAVVTQEGAAIFLAIATGAGQNQYAHFTGPAPATDRFGGEFFDAFGQNGIVLDVYELRGEYMTARAQLDDDTIVQVVGRSGPPAPIRWTKELVGAWPTPDHWTPNQVPGPNNDTLFALATEYTVEIDQREVRSVQVTDGTANFQGNALTVNGPLTIGRSATLYVNMDRMQVNGLTVGNLPPLVATTNDEAMLRIFGGTHFTATASTVVGNGGAGIIELDNAAVTTDELLIGRNAPGVVQLSGADGQWDTISLAVGAGVTGTLFIIDGATLASETTVIGHSDTPGNFPGSIAIDQANQPAQFTNWTNDGPVTIGANLPGVLQLNTGGKAVIQGMTQVGTVAHPSNPSPDGLIDVRSPQAQEPHNSFLVLADKASFGMADGARAQLQISEGGRVKIGKDLNLGVAAGSTGSILVAGFNIHLNRSTLLAGTEPAYVCRIGVNGRGIVTVSEGAQMSCTNMLIGNEPGSSGTVMVLRQGNNLGAKLSVGGAICVGGFALCGTTNGITGTLRLEHGGQVFANTMVVGSAGTVSGWGTIKLEENAIIAGTVAPSLSLAQPAVQTQEDSHLDGWQETNQLAIPSKLSIFGSTSISNTAIVELTVWGVTPELQSTLTISGNLTIDGAALRVNFGNGYAPKRNDVFDLVTATGTLAGDFAKVTITGLQPGFDYQIAREDGTLSLIARSDGVPDTKPDLPTGATIYLPQLLR
jgi:hypothetical protein